MWSLRATVELILRFFEEIMKNIIFSICSKMNRPHAYFSLTIYLKVIHMASTHLLNIEYIFYMMCEVSIPYNVLLLRYISSNAACPPSVPVYIETGLASAGHLEGVLWFCSIETFSSLPNKFSFIFYTHVSKVKLFCKFII